MSEKETDEVGRNLEPTNPRERDGEPLAPPSARANAKPDSSPDMSLRPLPSYDDDYGLGSPNRYRPVRLQ